LTIRTPDASGRGRVAAWPAVAIAALLALTLPLWCGGRGDAARTTTVLLARADSQVISDRPHENFGTSAKVHVDGQPLERTYLAFAVPERSRRFRVATLKLYALSSIVGSVGVQAAANQHWDERSIAWSNAPRPLGARVTSAPGISANSWISLDVTRLLNDGVSVLVLSTTGPTALALASRQAGARHAPRLVLDPRAPTQGAGGSSGSSPMPSGPAVVAAAGDIACDPADPNFDGGRGSAGSCQMRATSDLLLRVHPTAVLTLGDDQYECGGYTAFQRSYDASWGRLKGITRPAIGNHEYGGEGGTGCGEGASGYFRYFGAAAGPRGRGYYSFDVGAWHLISLNSNCSQVGGCDVGTPQERWLRDDLSRHRSSCTLAYWHHPRWSSGEHGDQTFTAPFWRDLYASGADVVLAGHDHDYERFAPQRPDGTVDRARGMREFVVGTGGKNPYPLSSLEANSERSASPVYGVLILTLLRDGYRWRFVSDPGSAFTDAGSGACH
jgi:hypothetical protein